MTRIKICGIRTEEQAIAAARAGADFIGLVFAPSPRQITPALAKTIITELRARAKNPPEVVGVFVNAPVAEIKSIATMCALDRVQLSGDETTEYCRELARPIIKVLRVAQKYKDRQVWDIISKTDKALARLARLDCILMLDTYEKGKYGGTGKRFDLEPMLPVFNLYKLMLAGGLTPENVGEAVKTLKPWGVDVSSGVETGGVKDLEKIKEFIKAVRQGDAGSR